MKIKVEFIQKIPDGISNEDIFEWIQYLTGVAGSMSLKNPLRSKDLEAECCLFRIIKDR